MSQACQPHLVLSLWSSLFFFFFCPCRFFSAQSWRRKRAPATPRPQSHLRQMKQPLPFSCSPPPFPSSLPSPPPSLSKLRLCAGRDEPNPQELFLMHAGGGWEGWVGVWVFVCGVNIGVKCRGHTDQRLRGRRRRESNYVHCTKHKSTLIGRITTASYLASLCLPFFSTHIIIAKHTLLCIYTRLPPTPHPSPLQLSFPAPLSPPIISCFSLLASLHALLHVPSRHIGLRNGNLALPGSPRTGATLHTVIHYGTFY